jgi:hypothetical protein
VIRSLAEEVTAARTLDELKKREKGGKVVKDLSSLRQKVLHIP